MLAEVADVTDAAAHRGFHLGLLLTAFGFGLRHGIDWDHLAAITDITSTQESGRRSMALAGLYAVGHAAVVVILGVLAIAAGDRLPTSVDAAMGRVVGASLVLLGVYVFWALYRDRGELRMRSRWLLLFDLVRRLRHRLRRRLVTVEHEHEHVDDHHDDAHPGHAGTPATSATSATLALPAATAATGGRHAVATRAHTHPHRHVGPLPDDPFPAYGWRTALGIGALHGIGAETPTQVLVFVAAAGVAGAGGGVLMLLAFVVGLLVTNTAIALASTFGFLQAGRSPRAYVAVAVLSGVAGLVVGTLFLLGREDVLPPFFGG